jgi:uncharacterized protein (DUF2147 family)
MVKRFAVVTAAALALTLAPSVGADTRESPEGSWQVYDDHNGRPNGAVRLYIADGKLNGVVEALRPGVSPDERCTKCSGSQKDKPILGLVVVWGLTQQGDEWSGGTVLDPDSGDTYRCTIKIVGPGKLDIRGYLGISLFGRTQHWTRLR